MNETTTDKVRAYKNGDLAAMNQLLEQFEPLIKSQARDFGANEKEDAAQELRIALFQAVQQIEYFDSEAQVNSYIIKSVKSKKIYLYRKHKKKCEYETAILEDMEFKVRDNAYEDAVFYTDLVRHIEKMPKKYRNILTQILEGKNDSEIADNMNLSRQYVNRIKKKMLSEENIF